MAYTVSVGWQLFNIGTALATDYWLFLICKKAETSCSYTLIQHTVMHCANVNRILGTLVVR